MKNIDRVTIAGMALTIIGFTWVLHRDHTADVHRAEEWYRQDKVLSEQKWAALFEKFHILDKDLEKFKIPSKELK